MKEKNKKKRNMMVTDGATEQCVSNADFVVARLRPRRCTSRRATEEDETTTGESTCRLHDGDGEHDRPCMSPRRSGLPFRYQWRWWWWKS